MRCRILSTCLLFSTLTGYAHPRSRRVSAQHGAADSSLRRQAHRLHSRLSHWGDKSAVSRLLDRDHLSTERGSAGVVPRSALQLEDTLQSLQGAPRRLALSDFSLWPVAATDYSMCEDEIRLRANAGWAAEE